MTRCQELENIKGEAYKMAASTYDLSRSAEGLEKSQLGIGTILLMFAWPALWYTLLIYGLGQWFIPDGGTTPTWFRLVVFVLGGGAELSAGLYLLHREGCRLSLDALRDRLRLRWPQGWKAWALAVMVLVLGMSLSMAMEPLNTRLASVPGFSPPAWWGAASNPNVQVNGTSDVFPDINLLGNYPFIILYFAITLVFNIFGEEIYYRGYLLPRMRGAFGKWDWIANGVFFTLKHVYQRWVWPGVLVGGLCFAFSAGPLGSLPLAMVYHWVGNFLYQMVFLVLAALGMG